MPTFTLKKMITAYMARNTGISPNASRTFALLMLATVACLLMPRESAAQKASGEKEAVALFHAGKYAEALPLLEQIAGRETKNTGIRLIYGTTLGHLGRDEDAIAVLAPLSKRTAEACLPLAEALYRRYRFADADEALERYARLTSKRRQNDSENKTVAALSKQIGRARLMAENCLKIVIVDSIVLPKSEVLKAYRLSRDAGSLLPASRCNIPGAAPQGFAYLNARRDRAIYPVEIDSARLAAASTSRINGQWVDTRRLTELENGGTINSAFLREDGYTLIFSRKSEDGLGGYDLYMTRRDRDRNCYMEPTLLGMPFNSPYNDYLPAYDEHVSTPDPYGGIGYFASDRFQPEGYVCVYTFLIDDGNTSLTTDDPEEKIRRASLIDISNSRDPSVNPERILQQINAEGKSSPASKNASSSSFVFEAGGHVYRDPGTLHSDRAKEILTRAMSRIKDAEVCRAKLDGLRISYARATAAQRTALGREIQALEQEIREMEKSRDSLLLQARRLECRAAGLE